MVVLPLALFIIFIILYFQFRSVITTSLVFSGIAIAWAGGFLLHRFEQGARRHNQVLARRLVIFLRLVADGRRHARQDLRVFRLIHGHGDGVGARGLRGFTADLRDLADEFLAR